MELLHLSHSSIRENESEYTINLKFNSEKTYAYFIHIMENWSCTPLFKAALFIIAKTWKQPKCPLTDEWIKKMCYIFAQWNVTLPLKKYYNAICSNMDGSRDYTK